MINSVSIIIIGSVNGLPLRREGVRLSRATSEVISNNQSIKGALPPPRPPLFLHWPTLAVAAPLTGQRLSSACWPDQAVQAAQELQATLVSKRLTSGLFAF